MSRTEVSYPTREHRTGETEIYHNSLRHVCCEPRSHLGSLQKNPERKRAEEERNFQRAAQPPDHRQVEESTEKE